MLPSVLRLGHGIDYTNTTPWLKNKVRNTYPNELSFQYFKIDGGYRLGFGYVRTAELSFDNYYKKSFNIKKDGNTYNITTVNISGNPTGNISLYIDNVDFSKNIIVKLNGIEVFNDLVKHTIGTVFESISTFGDPKRIFSAKVDVAIQ